MAPGEVSGNKLLLWIGVGLAGLMGIPFLFLLLSGRLADGWESRLIYALIDLPIVLIVVIVAHRMRRSK